MPMSILSAGSVPNSSEALPTTSNLYQTMMTIRGRKGMSKSSEDPPATITEEKSIQSSSSMTPITRTSIHGSSSKRNLVHSNKPPLFTREQEACLYFLSKRGYRLVENFEKCFPSSTLTATQIYNKNRTVRAKTGEEAAALETLAGQQPWIEIVEPKKLSKKHSEARERYRATPAYVRAEHEKKQKKRESNATRYRDKKMSTVSVASTLGLSSPFAKVQMKEDDPKVKTEDEEEETPLGQIPAYQPRTL